MTIKSLSMKSASTAVLAFALALTGVSAPTAVVAQNSNPEAAQALGPITGDIRFSWWGGQLRNEKTDQILQLFEQENPGVTVARETSDFLPYWERLTIQSAGGNQPCAIQMQSRFMPNYARPEILMPLDELVASGALRIDGIPAPVVDAGRAPDGTLYMIPTGVAYFGIFYIQQMAEAAAAAGVPMPEVPYTWAQFDEYLRAVKPHLPEGTAATQNMGRETDPFVTFVQTRGEKMFVDGQVGFSEDTVKAWFEMWEGLRKDGITNTAEQMGTDNNNLIEESALANGRVMMAARPPNILGSTQRVMDSVNPGATIDILKFASGEDGTRGLDISVNGMSIGANCTAEQLPATVAWINFFLHDQRAADIYQSDNGVVAVDALAEAQQVNPDTHPAQARFIEVYREIAPHAMPVFWPPGGLAAMSDVLPRAYDAVAFEQISIEEGAAMVIEEVNEQLARANR
jgi:multiple sugar transport system substrate-binding protein